jgi:hypothetical protein
MEQPPLSACLCIDFETYYDEEVSVSIMSPYEYMHHPRFDAYLVSMYNGGDISWVGDPKECDWSKCHDKLLVAHNVGFDKAVFDRLQELGVIPADVVPRGWFCTADMVAYLRCKRDLKTAARILLGKTISKAVRTNMKGRTFQDAVAAGDSEELIQYGMDDSIHSWDLFEKYRDRWPEKERETSRIIREGAFYGMQTDIAMVDAGIKILSDVRDNALIQMPWADSHEDKPLSAAKIRKYGREVGIPVPASLAVTSPDVVTWAEEYGGEYPWVRAVSEYRSVNAIYKKLLNLKGASDAEGIMRFNIKYFGTHTGRASGGTEWDSGGKLNMLNLPREAMFGVDLRSMLIARPGHVLMAPDLAQIEARFLLWTVKDTELLDLVKKEGNIYQAYAKKRGWYSGNDIKTDDRKLYDRVKATVLSLGYASGHAKFRSMAESKYGVVFTEDEARSVVLEYRADNPKVTKFWRDQNAWLRISTRQKDPTHEIALPSGRDLIYYNPVFDRGDIRAEPAQGMTPRKLYGGLLTENYCQAGTRDILCDGRRAIEAASNDNRILFDVYDELVIEIPEYHAEERAEEIAHLMVSSSPWAEGCPIEVEYKLVDNYRKG